MTIDTHSARELIESTIAELRESIQQHGYHCAHRVIALVTYDPVTNRRGKTTLPFASIIVGVHSTRGTEILCPHGPDHQSNDWVRHDEVGDPAGLLDGFRPEYEVEPYPPGYLTLASHKELRAICRDLAALSSEPIEVPE